MFSKVLVANRGEIACRVIRALHERGIQSVAVCSEADRSSKAVRMAGEVVVLGPAPSAESYLRVDRIIAAAKAVNADAIHPGYGFLSESERLREACDEASIVFIGPSAQAMRVMGEKTSARRAMQAAGVPIVPGTTEAAKTGADALKDAEEIGFPVLLKAAAGGGGKGMRLVTEAADLETAFEACSREAVSAFGDGAVYLERAILQPRHIEIQVLADRFGQAVHLFERECSVQRRHQKVIEEAPAAVLSEKTRQEMGAVAVAAAKAIAYEGAGTVEFLVDQNEQFYFLEMNTRLQVEHPVTEMITGIDLVDEQLRIAAGEPLGRTQADLNRRGHSIECRLYAEDPFANFLPSPGPLLYYRPPGGPGIRVDDGVSEGDEVTSHYDPMVAKIISWAETRTQAIERMRRALGELRVGGIRTNVALLQRILSEPAFCEGRYTTRLVEGLMPLPAPTLSTEQARLLAAVSAVHFARGSQGESKASSAVPVLSPWGMAGRKQAMQGGELS